LRRLREANRCRAWQKNILVFVQASRGENRLNENRHPDFLHRFIHDQRLNGFAFDETIIV